MRTVRRVEHPQLFRPYKGPPPSFSRTQALAQGRRVDGYRYLLGLWDVGTPRQNSSLVTWRAVWIVGYEVYLDDLSQLFISGPIKPPPGTTPQPLPVEAGWVRYITMRDAHTGAHVRTSQF